jgi:hypothetical protein
VAVSLLPCASIAQPAPKTAQAAAAQRATTITFDEDDLIDGRLNTPELEVISGRPTARSTNLIRVREDFNDKVLESAGGL